MVAISILILLGYIAATTEMCTVGFASTDELFFISQPKNITATENDNVMLTYVVNGSYQTYAFSINGEIHQHVDLGNRVMLQGNYVIFTIRNVSLNLHLNSYQCILFCGPQRLESHIILLYIGKKITNRRE